jgi:multisubunit Na+/H+ antiporter MnhF subunit
VVATTDPWLISGVVLLALAVAPAALLGARGTAATRLVGLEMVSAVTVITLMLLSQADGNSSFLIVPLVLALLSVAGTLVFTRLLAPRK